ncbi:cadherin-related family member 5 isoform X2 [Rhineura floridana]|uniref:cadherin-related family member 5 isoform X2 n=1 Tax=Rhineura floridana TaxID=261503 RepID=UPI002AC81094|nr:cadherin-related family member 5 isoform X2 [Rhineura floridana]
MAHFSRTCTCVLSLLLLVIQVQTQSEDCSVQNVNPSVLENNPPGFVVTNITTAAGVTVTIVPSTEMDSDWFAIKDSQLILTGQVDYENTSVLLVELQCLRGDIDVNHIIVVVTIINVNDNPPVFKESSITVNVTEDTKVNITIVPQANVTAVDYDNDVIFYSLTGNPPEGMYYFDIQGVNNPEIYLRNVLDYEKINFMQFVLYAMDGNVNATGTHTASVTIIIHILQTDRRPPWFQPCTFVGGRIVCITYGYTGKINISENVTEPLVLEPGPLYAIDGDRDLDEKIVYEIAAGNDDDTFSITTDTGNITMNNSVNALKTFMLYVVASQANNPFRYSQTTVEIKVVRRNDHKPYFEKALYMGTVSADLPVSSLVMESGTPSVPLRIFAADGDFPDKVNPDIIYKIDNSTNFIITRDGFLLTTEVLRVATTITLLAIANDTAALQEASTLITVDVIPSATTTILPTTTTTAVSGIGTTISNTSDVPPGIITTLPVKPSESTTLPASTTMNTGITKNTGKPVTSTEFGSIIPPFVTTVKPPISKVSTSQPQTTNTPITGVSQAISGTAKSTALTPSQSEVTKPSVSMTTSGTVQSASSASSQTGAIDGVSPATDGTGQSTARTPYQTGTTKHPITGDTTPTTGGSFQSTSLTPKSASSNINSAATPTSSKISSPSTQMMSTSSDAGAVLCGLYKAEHMAAVGTTLGVLLVITLVLLGLISYKYYKMKHERGEDISKFTEGSTNANFQGDEKDNSDGKDDKSPPSIESENDSPVIQKQLGAPSSLGKTKESSQASTASETIREDEEDNEDTDSEKEVRSILTKDRKVADDGYKAVWFKEDIDPEAKDDVLVIENDSDAERNRNDSDSDNADDEAGDNENDGGGSGGDNDRGRGGSALSFISRTAAHLPETDSTVGGSPEDTEENDVFL